MSKELKKLITLVITKDDPKKLDRVLQSIHDSEFLSKSEIIVIDNSSKRRNRTKNNKLILNLRGDKTIYIDKFNWIKIKKVLYGKIKNNNNKKLLKEITLGTNDCSIHHARNAVAIICYLLYQDEDIVLCLDDDMIIPKNFNININNIDYPSGIVLKGSPDLSRLEWMRLYNLLQNKIFNKMDEQDYVLTLTKSFSKSVLEQLISAYTNIQKNRKINDLIIFPKREELNGGSFVTPVRYIIAEIYPPWFDNDWFWFRRNRERNHYPIAFINGSVVHLSSKKDVFNKKLLKFEEIGKIMTGLLKQRKKGCIPNNNEIKKEWARRKNIIENEISLSRGIIQKIKNQEEIKIISHLEFLSKFLNSIKLLFIKEQIASYEKKSKYWCQMVKEVKKHDNIKPELFKFLNQKEILIFSPHCDDVIFSIGGAIRNGYFKKIKVYTVYTKTNYYLNKPEKMRDITKARLNEEVQAFKQIGVSPKFLGFNDSTMREYLSEKDYMSPLNDPKKDSIFVKIKKEVNRIIKNKRDKILIFPLGIGYNIDHTILFEIGKELDKNGCLVLFYEDVGYDMTKSEDAINDYVKNKMPRLIKKTFCFNDIKAKLKLCKIYKTQVSKRLIKDIEEIAIRREGERIFGTAKTFRILNL